MVISATIIRAVPLALAQVEVVPHLRRRAARVATVLGQFQTCGWTVQETLGE
jgi:hypothetical protein